MILFITADKLNQKKFKWFYRLILKEVASLGVSRTTNLAYNTVVDIIRKASVKGQMVHNEQVQQVETEEIASDEFWSFVPKNRKTVSKTN